ncbi:MAG: hypothetical protein CMD25_00750 [Flavobacteriales bacterium]|nr:hypothetical protein [Flavobacteriales bacterium]
MNKEMINELVGYEGKQFSDNFSNTNSSLCLKVDAENDTVYYQECYSQYGNFTGKNIKGEKRTDELRHPRTGLKTMTLHQFYGAAIGWI